MLLANKVKYQNIHFALKNKQKRTVSCPLVNLRVCVHKVQKFYTEQTNERKTKKFLSGLILDRSNVFRAA